MTRQLIYSSYINSEKIRLDLHCFNWLHVLSERQSGSPSLPFPKEQTKPSYKKHVQNFETHDRNTNHCPKVWNFPTLWLQPTRNGGATSTTPSPLTKSIGIFLLVDYEEGKKSLHLQKRSLQKKKAAKQTTKFNHKKTPEPTAIKISSNIKHSSMLKRSIQLTPQLWISFVLP